MTSTVFGLSPVGFNPMRQSDIAADLQQGFTTTFGSTVNLAPQSVNGQLINIMAERMALLWEMGEAIYLSRSPLGAEGTSVDAILAQRGQKRLGATYAVTNNTPVIQPNQITLYGLVLYGAAGTVVPGGTQISDSATPPNVFALDNAVTIQAASNAQQTLVLSNVPNVGSFKLSLVDATGATLITQAIGYQAQAKQTWLTWATVPTSGTYTLTALGVTTTALAYYANAQAVQAALIVATGMPSLTVAGSIAAGMMVSFPAASPIPTLTASGDASAPTVVNCIQAAINSLTNTVTGLLPFTDVTVAASGSAFVVSFGTNTPTSGQPSSAAIAQPLILINASTLQAGATVTNLTILDTVQGAPAQGIGTATATVTGPISVAAGALSVVANPILGLTGITNQLAILPGSTTETDEEALLRSSNLLAALAQGPLQGVLQAVLEVSGVSSAIAFQNLTNAAQQILSFGAAPTTGSYQLSLRGLTTTSIAYNATASTVQTAIQALSGFTTTLVTGNNAFGFVFDFNGSNGGQGVDLMTVVTNTTAVTIIPTYGRPPKSVEIVVSGGNNAVVAQAIYDQGLAGFSTYGSPIATTTGSPVAGSSSITVASTVGIAIGQAVTGFGINPGSTVTSIQGSTVVLNQIALGTYSGVPLVFNNATLIADSNGNPILVSFSRPSLIPVYISINLVTDLYKTPGVASSGLNPASLFSAASIATIQANVVAIGNAIPTGGLIVGQGTNGLVGSFNDVPGIVSFSLTFGTAPSPTNTANIALLPTQDSYFSVQNTQVSFT